MTPVLADMQVGGDESFLLPRVRKKASEWVGYLLKVTQHALRQMMDARLKDVGVNAPQLTVLLAVAMDPGASNASLARGAFVTPQSMQGMLANLERSGLISRSPHPQHGRIIQTELTSRGRRAVQLGADISDEVERLMLSDLSRDEASKLEDYLRRCSASLGSSQATE